MKKRLLEIIIEMIQEEIVTAKEEILFKQQLLDAILRDAQNPKEQQNEQ